MVSSVVARPLLIGQDPDGNVSQNPVLLKIPIDTSRINALGFARTLCVMRPEQQQLAQALLKRARSISEVARTFNVHPGTIYRLREHQTADFKLAS